MVGDPDREPFWSGNGQQRRKMNGYTCIVLLILTACWAQLAVAAADLESCALCPAAVEPVCDPGGMLTFNNRCLAECQGILNSLPGACEGAMRHSTTPKQHNTTQHTHSVPNALPTPGMPSLQTPYSMWVKVQQPAPPLRLLHHALD